MAKRNTPPAPTIPLDLWRELYQAAASFQLLAPWQWMDDTHVFGVNNEHGVRLVTVLGSMGEVFPKTALGVDAATGMILAFQLTGPDQTLAQTAACGLVQSIQASGCRPAAIKMDSINLIWALQPLADAIGAELLQAKSLPMANEARRSLEAFNRQS